MLTDEQRKKILNDPNFQALVPRKVEQPVQEKSAYEKSRELRSASKRGKMTAVEQPKKDGFFKSVGKAIAKPFGEVGVGLYNAAKATADLARGDIQEAGQELESSRNLPFLGETKPFMTGQEGFGEFAKKTVGYGADIGSNVVGGFGVGQVAKSGFKGALKQGVSAGLKTGASTGALVGAGQSLEENKDALNVLGNTLGGAVLGGATGGALGGATATAGKVIRGVLQPGKTISDIGKGIKGAGESIQQRVIKPTQKDIKAGFKIENVSKYDVGGNLGDSFVKVKDQIKSNMDELNNIVSTIAPKKRYKFDLENYVNELEDKYRKGGVQLLGQGKKVLDEVENLKGELDLALGNNWRDNLSGFEDVLDIKRRAGLNAAFMHDATKSQPTPEEKVWTDFYMLLKDKLEKEAPPEFQAVNKRLSELIPIEQALIRRIPIAERQNVLNVADIVSLSAGAIDPRALTIGVLNRVLKSGTVASKLMQAGSKIEGAGAKLAPTDELIKSIPSNNKGFARLPFNQQSTKNISWLEKNADFETSQRVAKDAFNNGYEVIPIDSFSSDMSGKPVIREKIKNIGDFDNIPNEDGYYIFKPDEKIPFSSPAVGKTVEDTLIQEAKKYKSAEEFVNEYADTAIPRSVIREQILPKISQADKTNSTIKIGKVGDLIKDERVRKELGAGLDIDIYAVGENIAREQGFRAQFLSDDLAGNRILLSPKMQNVNETIIHETLHGLRVLKGKTGKLLEETADIGGKNISKLVKTKSQLTDIWNKANKK